MNQTDSQLLPYARRSDFRVARASELTGRDRRFYRFLEILPGLTSWLILIGVVLAAIYASFVAAYFILAFAIYWVLKTFFMSYHVRYNWKRLRHHMELDWEQLVQRFDYAKYYHLVVLPFYEEPESVINDSLAALAASKYDTKKILVVLAAEERAGESAAAAAAAMKEKWEGTFGAFLVTIHPDDIPGEIAGKGSNVHYALKEARDNILDAQAIPYEDVMTSVLDIDTVVYPDYFNCLMWHFHTAEKPYQTAFQPVPLFVNNLWEAPAISRVMAMSSTFWQMIMQERPDRAATFSSHSVSFKALNEIGFGQANVVSEDSRIFWNLLLANNGDFSVMSLSYPIAMDATVAPTIWQTIKNIYRQHRRWTYGVENWVYLTYHFTKHTKMPLRQRLTIAFIQGEGYSSLVTNPLILFCLGWLPVFLGTAEFHQTVLSYELPIMVRNLLTFAMLGLIISAVISLSLTPARPEGKSWFRYVVMALQWVMVPFTMIAFSAIPGLDAQTRLLFGKYMGFWVTPKRQT